MALVTLSAVAEIEKYVREMSLKDQIITSLVFPHLDESLHLGDPLLDGLVHRLPPLDVGSVHLVRLQEQKMIVRFLLHPSPLRELSSSELRRCHYPELS